MKQLIAGIVAFLGVFLGAGAMRCYVCSSYMEQCKTYVHTSKAYAHRGRCYSKCFTRLGEDGAIYRGCFDGFREVPFLTSSYDGCKNQTWNGQSLPWCLCKGELCNGVSMADMGYGNDIDLSEGYRVQGHYHRATHNNNFNTADTGYASGSSQQGGGGSAGTYEQSINNVNSQETSYGFETNHVHKQEDGKKDSSRDQFAKEGVVQSENSFGIKEFDSKGAINEQQNQNQPNTNDNSKYPTQDYYPQNVFMPSYYNLGDYDKFHYSYQVEDPNAYMAETDPAKYIAMDESEGFKVNIDVDIDSNKVEEKEDKTATDVKKSSKLEKSAKEQPEESGKINNNEQGPKVGQSDDVYTRNDYVYNASPYGGQSPQQVLYPDSYRYSQFQNRAQEKYTNTGLNEDFKEEKKPEEDPYYFPPHLADRIECAKTGFYQNPDDCRTFVACILDAHVRRPYMHLMRCPQGLVWDNTDKICNQFSTTCNVGGYIEGSYEDQIDQVSPQGNPVQQGYEVQSQEQQTGQSNSQQVYNSQAPVKQPQEVYNVQSQAQQVYNGQYQGPEGYNGQSGQQIEQVYQPQDQQTYQQQQIQQFQQLQPSQQQYQMPQASQQQYQRASEQSQQHYQQQQPSEQKQPQLKEDFMKYSGEQ